MTLYNLLLKHGIAPTNYDLNKMGVLVAKQAKLSNIKRKRVKQKEVYGDDERVFVVLDYHEDFEPMMLEMVHGHFSSKIKYPAVVEVKKKRKRIVKPVASS